MRKKNLFFVIIFLIIVGCQSENPKFNEFQKKISHDLSRAESTNGLISVIDTLKLEIQSDSLDDNPIVKISPKYLVLANQYLKSVYKFNKDGKLLLRFGSEGEGPGEFRDITAISLDENGRIYIYDRIESVVSIFNEQGKCLKQLYIKHEINNIRHICALNGLVFLHHAPMSNKSGFISIYDSTGFLNYIGSFTEGYKQYYMRGFLDGSLISDYQRNIYEVNVYANTIRKISNQILNSTSTTDPSIRPLKKTMTSVFEELVDNYKNVTKPLKLFLVDENKLLFVEYLNNAGHSKKDHFFQVFDATNFAYIGNVKINDSHYFHDSDGKFLYCFVDPQNFPPKMNSRIQQPSVIIYKTNF
ncbi:MAG: hypothetical protein FD143_3204 [Ignavibacteria bacterium]|nr:MAG: hypothetical protein FD143_3204 [Ignavibacteria bacterium]KAF0153939.1 MAG: hypothetical protein FD188_3318 [Ignavibacteria bacterium]